MVVLSGENNRNSLGAQQSGQMGNSEATIGAPSAVTAGTALAAAAGVNATAADNAIAATGAPMRLALSRKLPTAPAMRLTSAIPRHPPDIYRASQSRSNMVLLAVPTTTGPIA